MASLGGIQLALIAAIVFLAFVVRGMSGFGAGLIAVFDRLHAPEKAALADQQLAVSGLGEAVGHARLSVRAGRRTS